MTNYGKTKVKDLPVLISDKSIFCEGGGRLLSDIIYPIGSIYISTVSTNPSEWFGGVWEAFATGRTLVGIDTSQTEFNTILKTGGSKHLQAHSHNYGGWIDWYAKGGAQGIIGVGTSAGSTSTTGSGNSGNLQPYIVVYMWKRIS